MDCKQKQNIMIPLHARLCDALGGLPKELNDFFSDRAIEQWSMIKASEVNHLKQSLQIDLNQLCLMLLPLAAAYADTPISQFNVGAIVVDEKGNFYFGANFEFANTNMAQTIHAEQSAISHAWIGGAEALKLLVVNYPPCGHCRQFINETQRTPDFQIQLPDRQPQSFAYYLPEAFGPGDLGVSARILDNNSSFEHAGQSTLFKEDKDELFTHAYRAFLLSHSPYSRSESGVALEYEDGEIVIGSYGENAAYNPSLPPLQVALNYRRMQGKQWDRVLKRVCMIERNANMSQKTNTKTLLQTFTNCELEYHLIED